LKVNAKDQLKKEVTLKKLNRYILIKLFYNITLNTIKFFIKKVLDLRKLSQPFVIFISPLNYWYNKFQLENSLLLKWKKIKND